MYQCSRKTFMAHQTFVWWAWYILFKFVKSPIRHLGLTIGNIRHVRRFSWTLMYLKIFCLQTHLDIARPIKNVSPDQIYSVTSIPIHFRLRCSPCPIQWGWHIVIIYMNLLWILMFLLTIVCGILMVVVNVCLDHGLALCTFIVLEAIKYLYSYSEMAHWHLYLDSDVLCWKRQINLINDIFWLKCENQQFVL